MHYDFFQHKQCEFFPCHEGLEEDKFSCLFCYCPLYVLGEACGGDFVLLEDGGKDCTACAFPHRRENYGAIKERYPDILALINRR